MGRYDRSKNKTELRKKKTGVWGRNISPIDGRAIFSMGKEGGVGAKGSPSIPHVPDGFGEFDIALSESRARSVSYASDFGADV